MGVFDLPDGTSKHLLILYSLVVGTNALTILEWASAAPTGALRAAAHATGGVVHTCDFDERRFSVCGIGRIGLASVSGALGPLSRALPGRWTS